MSNLKYGEVKTKEYVIDSEVLAIREILELVYHYTLPSDISEKIQELIFLIDEKYIKLPECTNDFDIITETYKVCYEYKEIVS